MAVRLAYKSILAPVSGDPGDAATLRSAALLAQRFNGHVDAVFANPRAVDLVPTTGEGVSASVVEQLIKAARAEIDKRLALAKQTVEQIATEAGLVHHDTAPGPGAPSWHFRHVDGREDEIASAVGVSSDIIVLDRDGEDGSPQPMLTIEEALMSSGRPLMIAPRSAPGQIGETVAIAWSPTSQAAHALLGAMPLIASASAVHILSAETRKTASDAGEALVDNLARHGVEARFQSVDVGSTSVGAALLQRAVDLGCDVMVMGGYSHNRWRQMILGGVTRHVLGNATIPVIMAH